jgi:hypothetical protein
MPDRAPSRAQIDALLRFLPLFEQPERAFVLRWQGGQPTETGAIQVPYPVYAADVLAFIELAGHPFWSDYGYEPTQARVMLEDEALLARATLDQVKTMLTYVVRGERFCDGHWEAMLKAGRVQALLWRLAELREELPAESL